VEAEIYGRCAIALALFGPSLIGVAVPVTSGLLLRKRRGVRPAVAAGALVLWVVLSVATAFFLLWLAGITAMGWADSRRTVPTSEQLELLAIITAGLLALIACGTLLHRLVLRTFRHVQ
jgi:UDP-N-acetylmuramyl pentapeptide phosphotransferase/UDP-N-acetylglucosamine-1-phosphate transferase